MEASAQTVVSPLRFSKRNMLYFLCGAVAAQRLAVAIEYEGTNCLRARAAEPHGHWSSSVVLSKCIIMDLEFEIFDSERLITAAEKMPAL
jgi:hypothetical protein